jgi:hypothetical protein
MLNVSNCSVHEWTITSPSLAKHDKGDELTTIYLRVSDSGILIQLMSIVHCPAFYLKLNILETGFCHPIQVKAYTVGNRSPYLISRFEVQSPESCK